MQELKESIGRFKATPANLAEIGKVCELRELPLLAQFSSWVSTDLDKFHHNGFIVLISNEGLVSPRPSLSLILDSSSNGLCASIWHDGRIFVNSVGFNPESHFSDYIDISNHATAREIGVAIHGSFGKAGVALAEIKRPSDLFIDLDNVLGPARDRQNIFLLDADITQLKVGAVVNSANLALSGGGGVDGAIHRAAGPILAIHCSQLKGNRIWEAIITPGFGLPAPYIIHAFPPPWDGGFKGEQALLAQACRSALEIAKSYGVDSVAIPPLAMGNYGFPPNVGAQLMVDTIRQFQDSNQSDMKIIIAAQQNKIFAAFEKVLFKST